MRSAFPVRAELGVAGDVDTLFDGLTAGLGDRPLDILVNNAALTAGGLDRVGVAEFDRRTRRLPSVLNARPGSPVSTAAPAK